MYHPSVSDSELDEHESGLATCRTLVMICRANCPKISLVSPVSTLSENTCTVLPEGSSRRGLALSDVPCRVVSPATYSRASKSRSNTCTLSEPRCLMIARRWPLTFPENGCISSRDREPLRYSVVSKGCVPNVCRIVIFKSLGLEG